MAHHKRLILCFAAILAVGLVPGGAVFAIEDETASTVVERSGGDDRVIAREAELESIRRSMSVSQKRQAALESEIKAIEADRARLSRDLIEAAQRSQRLEFEISRVESQLKDLYVEEDAIRASLLERRDVLAEVLSALQRMGRTPPPALLSRPEDAVAAIRGSILANAVLPDIRIQAEELARSLEDLTLLKSRIEDSQSRLKSRYAALGEQQSRINLLIGAKKGQRETTAAELAEERRKAAALASEAISLESLVRKLEKEVASAARAAREAEAAAKAAASVSLEEAQRRLADTSRIRPAVRFSEAKGLLPMPIAGNMVMQFGDPDGFGGTSQGLSIAGRPGSPVLSPADGWVIYAGPFRSFGQVLILNAGEDYRIVLAGLGHINVDLGQFVLAGEPVAVLGEKKLAGLGDLDQNLARPMLYVEFRYNENSIDPAPWWDKQNAKEVRG
ncbi:MAG TPA: peptidoglycan DD-metalloendopeptidase family protein [Afifellaceae bacterium]|nr:peptidoglycan DD-metalloendopeptidase family protein [Afifellaceae bacterium]